MGTPEPTNEGYGWSKRTPKKQGMYYAQEYDMKIAITRPFFETSMPEGYPRRAADKTKPKAVTYGWEPEVSLEAGLAEMIEWYMNAVLTTKR